MSAQTCTLPPPAFARSVPQQISSGVHAREPEAETAVLETLEAPDQGILARTWDAFRAWRHAARLRNLAKELDPHLLQDVGAPAWLINETTLRRDLDRLRNAEYVRW